MHLQKCSRWIGKADMQRMQVTDCGYALSIKQRKGIEVPKTRAEVARKELMVVWQTVRYDAWRR